jgi:hypothetical protein
MDGGRELAEQAGERHNRNVGALEAAAAAHGGGLPGLARAGLQDLQSHGDISDVDRSRLEGVVRMLEDALAGEESGDLVDGLPAVRREIVEDPASSPLAVWTASVAVSSAERAVAPQGPPASHTQHAAVVAADVAGLLIGSAGGVSGALAAEAAASFAAAEVVVKGV